MQASPAPGPAADGQGPATPATSEGFYRPELDGLRFFAFLAVYMEHTLGSGSLGEHHHLPNWLGDLIGAIGAAGNFGVDLFFVLSSYLITELLLRERTLRGALDVRAFYMRRILRIWPLYFFFVFFSWGLTFFVASEQLSFGHVLGFLFFAGNWVYFLVPVVTVAGPLWSVSLEEQFYLIWPWVVRRSGLRRLALLAASLLLVGIATRVLVGSLHPLEDWVSKNSFSRIDGIAVGALIAVVLRGRVPAIPAPWRILLLAASLGVLLWVAYAFGLFRLPVAVASLALGWTLAAVACGGVLLSVLGSTGVLAAPLRSRAIVYLGRISFGLYVYHELLLKVAGSLFPLHDSSPVQMLEYWCAGIAGTIPVAAASYRWLELPFLRMKRERFTVVPSRPD
jgi:peptidoglycan/LPS O-acetylase OafA/YrhL